MSNMDTPEQGAETGWCFLDKLFGKKNGEQLWYPVIDQVHQVELRKREKQKRRNHSLFVCLPCVVANRKMIPLKT